MLFLRGEGATPGGGDFWAVYGPLLATLAAAVVGALVGTGLGALAGLRALARGIDAWPAPAVGLARAAGLGLLGFVGCALGGALLAAAVSGFQDVSPIAVGLVAGLCGVLGIMAAGYVGFALPLPPRTLVCALLGAALGGVPGALAVIGSAGPTPHGLTRFALVGAGLIGGLFAGLLLAMALPRAAPPPGGESGAS
jgi:hypothetical protein